MKTMLFKAFLLASFIVTLCSTTNVSGASKVEMQPTPSQVGGPYFLPNSPVSKALDLTPAGTTGDPIEVTGQVLGTDGTVLAGATVHVWLADPKGVYDNQDAKGNPISLPPSKHKLRGRIVTGADGKYYFKALRPGNYADGSAGKGYRPGHIHIKVEAPGYKTLVTQLYFQDDKYNAHDIDGDGFFKPELAIHMSPALPDGKTLQKGVFNFVLEKK
jgi:catechol 1,2-dioxygenase